MKNQPKNSGIKICAESLSLIEDLPLLSEKDYFLPEHKERFSIIKKECRKHIPARLDCSIIYIGFLNKNKKDGQSTIDADKECLNVGGYIKNAEDSLSK